MENTNVNEEYKFKISYIFNFFKDLGSSSEVVDDKELDSKIERIQKEQDNINLKKLEKEIEQQGNIKIKRKNEINKKNTLSNTKKIVKSEKNITDKEIGE